MTSRITLAVYARAEAVARERGVILADTKLEFGTDPTTGAVTLGDEVLTPDSSRFWPADAWEPGRAQPSFDKQFVRDWLTSPASGWDRESDTPPPALPADVVERTGIRFMQSFPKRFDPANHEIERLLKEKALGRVTLCRVRHGHSHGLTEAFHSAWFVDPARSGGGTLLDEGVHAADFLRWMFGEPDTAYATLSSTLGLPVEDTAVATFRYAGIPMAMLLGLLVWGDVPGPRMLAGAALIMGAGLYIVWRERRRAA